MGPNQEAGSGSRCQKALLGNLKVTPFRPHPTVPDNGRYLYTTAKPSRMAFFVSSGV